MIYNDLNAKLRRNLRRLKDRIILYNFLKKINNLKYN